MSVVVAVGVVLLVDQQWSLTDDHRHHKSIDHRSSIVIDHQYIPFIIHRCSINIDHRSSMVNDHRRSADYRPSIIIDRQRLLPIADDRQSINAHIRNPTNTDERSSSQIIDIHRSSIIDRRFSTMDEWRSRSVARSFKGVHRSQIIYHSGAIVGRGP